MSKRVIPAQYLSFEQLKEFLCIPVTEDEATEKFLDAEQLIDGYEAAVKIGGGNIPSRDDLGRACLYLLFHSGSLEEDKYFRTVTRLLSPAIGISMYECLPDVLGVRARAIAHLEKQHRESAVSCSQSLKLSSAGEDDIF